MNSLIVGFLFVAAVATSLPCQAGDGQPAEKRKLRKLRPQPNPAGSSKLALQKLVQKGQLSAAVAIGIAFALRLRRRGQTPRVITKLWRKPRLAYQ
jgi:hypothetical protein